MERRLTAILTSDVVGYSRLMGEDEVGTLARLVACRKEVIDPAIAQFHGHIVKLMGDGALVEFASIVDAVHCAAAIQRGMADYDQSTSEAQRIRLRIGVNLGDIIIQDNDIYGDGVNIAARLESLAEPGGICISGTAFDHAAQKVDVGFSALGEQKLKNIATPIRVYRILLDPGDVGKVKSASRRPGTLKLKPLVVAALVVASIAVVFAWQTHSVPERPSVAVLPFENLSGDPAQDYFADGITEDLITDLAKLTGLDVIARDSAFAYRGKPIVLAKVAGDLGVRYVVEGSVRRAEGQIRVNAALLDAATGKHVWTDRFDRPETEVFAVLDQMRKELVDALGVEPLATEAAQIARPPTANLEAYDYFLRGEQVARNGDLKGLREALDFYETAVELDPNFAEALAADARTAAYIWRNTYDDVLPNRVAEERAYQKASLAQKYKPSLPLPWMTLAILQNVDGHFDESIASAQKAVNLGPGDAEAYITLGYVQVFAGNFAEASAAIETALKLDPNLSPINRSIAGLVYFFNGDNDRAIAALERAYYEGPEIDDVLISLAAAYARGGRIADARAAIGQSIRLPSSDPSLAGMRINRAHYRYEKDFAFLIAALREAGMPEWPFGFREQGRERLKSDEIESLFFRPTKEGSQTLNGFIDPGKRMATMFVGADRRIVFFTGVYGQPRSQDVAFQAMLFIDVDEDLLCLQSENGFGRRDCGQVFKSADEYPFVFANSNLIFHFKPQN
ncbi:adenylate/guanylate cyclase domain-containing protein [Cypionkella psychrotolerans]|uniref:adenylate/guanylate cyclase domain-containing protein n=1 Tax=Cypionkella psychrotolerans TaxID=1678131 RepID=UPI0006B4A077|nr:adenylate/guanylate cyclase domain-containing protein [Cypionkella psychrotolerans]